MSRTDNLLLWCVVVVVVVVVIFIFSYRCGSGVLAAVVRPPEPQDVLGAVEELREAVKLAVGEVDGSLKTKRR